MAIISLIVAHDKNRVIGINNELPWMLPKDLEYFKARTLNKTVIMGRKTFESIGRPLPKRRNIVVTRDKNYHAEGVEICYSIESAIELAATDSEREEIMVIGGEQLFTELLTRADRLYITEIHYTFEGDTYFPPYDDKFVQVSSSEVQKQDDMEYYYKIFERVSE